MSDFNFDEWSKPSDVQLTLEQSLVKYIDENLGNTTYISASSLIIAEARKFTGITDGSIDIIGTNRISELTKKYWGGDEEHMAWRTPIINHANELNRIYFIGMVEGLVLGFKRNMIENYGHKTYEMNEIKFCATEYVDAVLQEKSNEAYYYD